MTSCFIEKFKVSNGIFHKDVKDSVSKKISNFYNDKPFTDYEKNETLDRFREKGNNNIFIKKLKDYNEKRFQEYSIYIFNIILFFIGFFRFYLPLIDSSKILLFNFLLFLFFFLIIFLYFFKYKFSRNIFILITGLLIFTPIAFVQNPVHAIIMGVTMHYSQYLVLTYIINNRRSMNYEEPLKNSLFRSKKKFIIIVFLYSIIMSVFSLSNKYSFFNLNFLILIPIIFQFLHFYFDSLLWRFSVAENRENTLNFIYSKS
jgi:hypothetical protein